MEAWRLALEAEADARALAERDAATGTDAWVAALTGSTREAAAGGIRLARLLSEKYAATREAFAAGRLRIEQVRVIVNAAEQIPASPPPSRSRLAEQWLVAQGTGDGTRDAPPPRCEAAAPGRAPDVRPGLPRADGRPPGRDARPRGTRRRGRDLAQPRRQRQRHLDREVRDPRPARPAVCNATSTPSPHPDACPAAATGSRSTDPTLPGSGPGLSWTERMGVAFTEVLEHLPTDGHAANGTTLLITIDLDALPSGLGAARLETGDHLSAGEARRLACNAGLVPAVLDTDLRTPGPRPRDPPAHQGPTPSPLPHPRLLRRHRLPTPLRLDRDPPPPPLVPRRPHRPRQRPPPLLLPPPPRPRHPLRPPPAPPTATGASTGAHRPIGLGRSVSPDRFAGTAARRRRIIEEPDPFLEERRDPPPPPRTPARAHRARLHRRRAGRHRQRDRHHVLGRARALPTGCPQHDAPTPTRWPDAPGASTRGSPTRRGRRTTAPPAGAARCWPRSPSARRRSGSASGSRTTRSPPRCSSTSRTPPAATPRRSCR